jgi:large subunit ribosomal protein L28
MARFCELTGKGPMKGHRVSHSNVKTLRRFLPNLVVKRFYIPEMDEEITIKCAASELRTIDKIGVYEYLRRLEKKA